MKRTGTPPPYVAPPCVLARPSVRPPALGTVYAVLPQSPLPAYEKLLLAMMVTQNPQQQLVAWPLRQLEQITSLSESSVKRALRALEVRCLLGVYEQWQPDGQPLPTAYQPWLWDLVKDPTNKRFSEATLELWESWVKAYEEGLEEAYKVQEQRRTLQEMVAKGKEPKVPKRPKLRASKYETRPWRLRCTMLDEEGLALGRLAQEFVRVWEEGKWKELAPGKEGIRGIVRAFWHEQSKRHAKPQAGVIEPSLCLRYWTWKTSQPAAPSQR